MDHLPRLTPLGYGALAAVAAIGSALWVEHASREAERHHHAPHHLLYVHGTRLHYRLVGEGPPVLLVHGNLVHGADFEASGLLARLAERYQVLVIDRPGFGHSDRPRGYAWTPARQARLLHQAAAALGVHRPVVVGHSLGAQVALAMALQEPADVAGLVLVSGYYWPTPRLDRWLTAPAAVPILGDVLRYTTSAWTARATLGATLRAIFDPWPVPEQFQHLLPRELLLRPLQQRATAEDGARMVAQARALRPHYATLRTPVTVVAGTEDGIVSPQQSVRLHATVPRARLRMVSGMGHMAHYQAHEQILSGIEEALAAGRQGLVMPGHVAAEAPVAGPTPLGASVAASHVVDTH
ncbi:MULTISPECIES: alpha/beta fold hydrolase [Ramlibacter]|uniref:Alpha/beta fold hydrolase n=1 Tax=Ramlibacter pinisoli TaxID=2682844 RepID=A0A6N8IR94_9BURK|nr:MULTISPECIES: alpha/beta hydrolase [Ramlibacter]MVQ28636.1 alpha/beta fold hydrolase [Ramlibacter pinisoli]